MTDPTPPKVQEPFTIPFSIRAGTGIVEDAAGLKLGDYGNAQTAQWLCDRLNAPAPAQVQEAVIWLNEAANYFERRNDGGEDAAFWANVYNAENCRKIAAMLAAAPAPASHGEREAFEAWCHNEPRRRRQNVTLNWDGAGYNSDAQYDWEAWQAALQSRATLPGTQDARATWRCACGWRGNPSQMTPTPAGGRACPSCGGTGGLEFIDTPSGPAALTEEMVVALGDAMSAMTKASDSLLPVVDAMDEPTKERIRAHRLSRLTPEGSAAKEKTE